MTTPSLRDRLVWAGRGLLSMPDPQADYLITRGYECAHDLGRWWDAALRLEATIGLAIPPHVEAACFANLQRLTDNPDRLLMCRSDWPATAKNAKLNPHNMRESLLAFGARIRYRQCAWARESARILVATMAHAFQPDGHMDYRQFGCWGMEPMTTDPSHAEGGRDGWFDGTATSGRCIEALVWLHEATGDAATLDLAGRIAAHHLEHSTQADGSLDPRIGAADNVGHNHSYQGTIRGLLLYGLATGDRTYVDRAEATYRKAIRFGIVKESGWTSHDLGTTRFANTHGDPVSDPASTGDAAQIALWLAQRAGCVDLLDDVGRYLRSRLFPAQMTPADMPDRPTDDPNARDMGAWTIHSPTHAGKGCTPDVHAAIIHSLCDIYQSAVVRTETGLRVDLHVDHDSQGLTMVTTREGDTATLTLQVSQETNLAIRIPGWVEPGSIRLTVADQPQPVVMDGHYLSLQIAQGAAPARVCVSYRLPPRDTTETMPSGRRYEFHWRGDEITGIDPQDLPAPFFPPITAANKATT